MLAQALTVARLLHARCCDLSVLCITVVGRTHARSFCMAQH